MKTIRKMEVVLEMLLIFLTLNAFSQVSINADGSQADPSAGLEVKFDNKGFLPPRQTLSQIQAIPNPANGLQVFCTTDNKLYIFISSSNQWKEVSFGSGTINPQFICGSPFTDPRDGQTYNTVQIGTQCWIAKNMNIGNRIDGVVDQSDNSLIEKYCYDNLESNCNVYGGLYQWGETVQYMNGASNSTNWYPVPSGNVTGICMPGWHLPSYAEVNTLIEFLGGSSVAGICLKEAGTTHWAEPNNGTNSSGFTALPGGARWYDPAGFGYITTYGYFWTTEVTDNSNAYHSILVNSSPAMSYMPNPKTFGFSVRCLKD